MLLPQLIPWLAAALVIPGMLAGAQPARCADTTIAVAANFADTVRALAGTFESETGHRLTFVIGSTGKLFAQIRNGAPFDLLLAADQERPARLISDGLAVADSRLTYAIGELILWSADTDRIGCDGVATLRRMDYRHLAIANPDLAPYGHAARQTLIALELWEALQDRIVRGENVGQAFAMVAGGGAELGLVSSAALLSRGPDRATGSFWPIPQHFYDPIRQDAVLLAHGVKNPAAVAFLEFLGGPASRRVIRQSGYRTE